MLNKMTNSNKTDEVVAQKMGLKYASKYMDGIGLDLCP